jgi:hypothetical protein
MKVHDECKAGGRELQEFITPAAEKAVPAAEQRRLCEEKIRRMVMAFALVC